MKIDHRPVTVGELTDGYDDRGDAGVVAYGQKLDVRPPYQRELVYNTEQQRAVIASVLAGLPLNVLYWARRDDPAPGEAEYEVLDGQQRTLSLCRFVAGDFSIPYGNVEAIYFSGLPADVQDQILNYQLLVYVCQGTASQKLEWFHTINIAGEKLTDQELRNAAYAGPWLSAAKKQFSRTGGAAAGVCAGFVKGTAIRQELLETALNWVSERDGLSGPDAYMAAHQHDGNATDLWNHWRAVLDWARATFPKERSQRVRTDWHKLYAAQGSRTDLDPVELEDKITTLLADDDVTNKRGVYPYVLDGSVKHLNIRAFTPAQKAQVYQTQGGLCARGNLCQTPGNSDGSHVFELSEMEADHITPWSQGGATQIANCQLLCKLDNRSKGNS